MKRRFINFLSMLSLALFIAVALLWIRSYFFRDSLVWKRVDNSVIKDRALFSWRCRIGIAFQSTWFVGNDNERIRSMYDFFRTNAGFQRSTLSEAPHHYWVFNTQIEKIGFLWDRSHYSMPPAQLGNGKMLSDDFAAALPDWLLLLLTSILPIRWVRAALRLRKRRRLRLCLHCGYDLRATAERCPECGLIAPPMSNQKPSNFDIPRALSKVVKRIKLPSLMLGYLAVTFFAIHILEPEPGISQPGFTGRGAWAMLIVFLGAFHLARTSRRPALFLAFGACGALLLIPSFLDSNGFLSFDEAAGNHRMSFADSGSFLEKGNAVIIGDLFGWIAFVVAIAFVTRLCAIARWHSMTMKATQPMPQLQRIRHDRQGNMAPMNRTRRIISICVIVCSTVSCVATALLWVFVVMAPHFGVFDISIGAANHEIRLNSSTPVWVASILFAIVPILYVRRWLRNRIARHRRLKARCTVCGYDLRETPDRCPECGTNVVVEADGIKT